MDEMDIRNSLLDELIDQMENSLAEKHYPSEKPKEDEAPIEEAKTEEAVEAALAPTEDELTEEDMAALEAVQGE